MLEAQHTWTAEAVCGAKKAVQERTEPAVQQQRLSQGACTGGGACLMSFDELCGRPVAAADYIALATQFHTLALDGIPVFSGAPALLQVLLHLGLPD